jgi:hypothetical protein|tara:strand:+ start:115 stop:384 length:270 start_codon:yes stop_codon:yes gene_type:complete
MTDRQIEQMAIRVADIVMQALEHKQKQWDTELVAELQESLPSQDEEQKLLTDLAEAMTSLDYNLKQENYTRCAQLQKEIIQIEKQLKQI